MYKTCKLFALILIPLIFALTGCEYDKRELLSQINHNNVVVDYSKFERVQKYFNFVPFDFSCDGKFSDDEKAEFLNYADDFFKYTYRSNYLLPETLPIESLNMMSAELSNTIKSSKHFDTICQDVQDNRIDVNIKELMIYDFYSNICDGDGSTSKMIFLTINLTITGGNIDRYTTRHPEVMGGDNIVDMAFIIRNTDGKISMQSWYESTRDPHQVTHFTPDGVIVKTTDL